MIGDSVVKTSRSGTRLILIRLRLATTTPSPTVLERRSSRWPPWPRSLLGGVAGQGQEHVVEGRPAQSDVVEPIPRSSSRRRASVSAGAPPVTGAVSERLSGRSVDRPDASAASTSAASPSWAAVGDGQLEPLAADLGLELVGGALGDHLAVVDDHDVVGQPVGLLQVLRGQQQGGAAGDQVRRSPPTCPVRPGGRARWSARRGRAPAGRRPGHRPGRAGAACRRSRSWPAGPPPPRAETSRAARAPGPGSTVAPRWYSRPIMSRFSKPVRYSSTAAYWPDSPMRRRTARGSASTSTPATVARPASGFSSVVSTGRSWSCRRRSGPSRPSTVPLGHGQVDPVEGHHVLVSLDQPCRLDRQFHASDSNRCRRQSGQSRPRPAGQTAARERLAKMSSTVSVGVWALESSQ